jgi:hypothetical protein
MYFLVFLVLPHVMFYLADGNESEFRDHDFEPDANKSILPMGLTMPKHCFRNVFSLQALRIVSAPASVYTKPIYHSLENVLLH